MKKKNGKIYVTENFKDLVNMHRSMRTLADRFGIYQSTMANAINNGAPVQSSFVANVLIETGIPFEKLFEVRK